MMRKTKKEFVRKFFHLAVILIPICLKISFDILGVKNTTICFVILSVLIIYLDFFNIILSLEKKLQKIQFFRYIARNTESKKYNLSGTSWVFIFTSIAMLLSININLIQVSLSILAISDTLAAVIGMFFGRIKIFSKTLEGSLIFFLSSLLILLYFYNEDIHKLIFISITTTIIELFSKKINVNDNFLIPISVVLTYILYDKILLLF